MDSIEKIKFVSEAISFYFGENFENHVKLYGVSQHELENWYLKAHIFSLLKSNREVSDYDRDIIFEFVDEVVNDYWAASIVGHPVVMSADEIGVDLDIERERYLPYIDRIPNLVMTCVSNEYMDSAKKLGQVIHEE